jgi:hypothetical protein
MVVHRVLAGANAGANAGRAGATGAQGPDLNRVSALADWWEWKEVETAASSGSCSGMLLAGCRIHS